MSEEKQLVIISAGGTGGHMSPAASLAHDLIDRGYRVELMTDPRGAKYKNMFGDINMHVVTSGTAGPGIMGKLKGAANLGMGVAYAWSLLRKLKPSMVVGFGGYPSVPGVYAAQKQGIPTILHEQNAIIGKANVFLAPNAERIALSLPYMAGIEKEDQLRTVITGNPVRPEIVALKDHQYPKFDKESTLNILVMGGSLGATVFSDVVPKALAQLPEEYRKRLNVVQQCREADLNEAKALYDQAGMQVELATFFDDVAGLLSKTHLFIGRSGASTVAEISAVGIPAIFVPYPHHKDQQQKKNAEFIADEGGAWVMSEDSFTEDALRMHIEMLFQNLDILPETAANAKATGRPQAAHRLGNLVIAIIDSFA